MVPDYWGINYQEEGGDDDAAPPFIGVDLKLEVEGKGFCETFTTVGSAVAGKLLFFFALRLVTPTVYPCINVARHMLTTFLLGAVHGVGGGIFTLLSLACN